MTSSTRTGGRPAATAGGRGRWLPLCALLAGCASVPDRFYTLNAIAPGVATPGAATQPTPVRLTVTVPAVVDRNEMVLETGANGVTIFEHARWASPLAGQVQTTLGRDLEAQRADLIVGDRTWGAAAGLAVEVDLVRMMARQGEPAMIEARWRIRTAAGADRLGAAVFTAGPPIDSVVAVPAAYSADLDLLAQRLVQEISRR